MIKIIWSMDPFPHTIIDNYLPKDLFASLRSELDTTNNLLLAKFNTPLESKTTYKDSFSKEVSKKLIKRMASDDFKEIISQQIGDVKIVTLGETLNYSGYSPYHITSNNGYLGAHVDHSFIENGSLRHIANSIFFASNKWEKGWGGQTILFSRNGLRKKVLIDPIPNRLVLFIHTANSFHGVQEYRPNDNIERRTFYHDYYIKESKINAAMDNLNRNRNRKSKLTHSFHGTTFIPFCPFGLEQLRFKKVFNIKNVDYLKRYFIYLFNRHFGTRSLSARTLIKNIIKIKIIR